MRRLVHSASSREVSCVLVGQNTTRGISWDVAGDCGLLARASRVGMSVVWEMLWDVAKATNADIEVGEWLYVYVGDILSFGFLRFVINREGRETTCVEGAEG